VTTKINWVVMPSSGRDTCKLTREICCFCYQSKLWNIGTLLPKHVAAMKISGNFFYILQELAVIKHMNFNCK